MPSDFATINPGDPPVDGAIPTRYFCGLVDFFASCQESVEWSNTTVGSKLMMRDAYARLNECVLTLLRIQHGLVDPVEEATKTLNWSPNG